MQLRSFGGVRLWPGVVAVWAIRVGLVAVMPVAILGLASAFARDTEHWVMAGTLALCLAWAGLTAAVLIRPRNLPHGLYLRYDLAEKPDDDRLIALAEHIGRRRPRRAERILRRGIAEGRTRHYRALAELLPAEERETLRRQLIATGTAHQLNAAADAHARNEPEAALQLQRAYVEHRPGDVPGRLELSALLAETGRFDEAMAVYRRTSDVGSHFVELMRIAQALAAAGRAGDAEAVLRSGIAVPTVLPPLVRLLLDDARASEAEELVRSHPQGDHVYTKYALSLVLERTGRAKQARALRPATGWPHEPSRRSGGDGITTTTSDATTPSYTPDYPTYDAGGSDIGGGGVPTETGSANSW
jgi:hypothetical protein